MSAAVTLERQIRPIYEALDTGSNKSAIVSCNKLLKKYPNNLLVKSLKALALVRSQKVEESLALCDEVLVVKPLDDATISAMMHVLKGLGRITDMVNMFEEAYKQQPLNEEYGAQTFFAHVRTANWKSAQQVSTRMHKQFQEDRYLYWSVMGAILQASDPTTTPSMKTLLYKLAHRLVTSSPSPSYLTADRFHMHISILKELELCDEANTLLESDIGKTICSTSLACDQTRREIWRGRGLFREEGESAQQKILNGDRNWLEFLSVLDSTFAPVSSQQEGEITEESKNQCLENVSKARAFLAEVTEKDGIKNRAAPLALLELEHRAYKFGLSDDSVVVGLMENYFTEFGDKACCFEDLISFLDLETTSLDRWKAFLAHHQPSFVSTIHNYTVMSSFFQFAAPTQASAGDLQRLINVRKLERYMLPDSEITVESEIARGLKYLEEYLEGIALGTDLPTTELQPADDLVLLAANAFVMVWALNHSEEALYEAATVLEYGLTKSRVSFQMRIMLVRIYRILGASPLALEHYRQMNVKQVQNDTLSHLILTRALTFSLAATGDLTYPSECLESSQIYLASSQETSDFVVRSFTAEKYTQIPDFIDFEDRLENSLQRDVIKLEHVRMRLTHEPLNTDIIDMELIELKFMFDRAHHDNRDFIIIPNYQPHCKPTFNDQTLLFGTSTGRGWLWCFLKIYIRAFQHASDLDDIVEEKLLVGDRPKKSSDPEVQLPLPERLALRSAEETAELTSDEAQLLDWATALGDWLEPHHNHVRPPPAVVLAEASRQTELKTGFPLRGVDLQAHNGDANGHPKKDEEAPPIKEAPGILTVFFDTMLSRFRHLLESKCSLSELLHVATITQEAFILFTIETMRFKSPAVVKIHKLGNLVSQFKDVRSKASCVLKEMSATLIKIGEAEGSSEHRRAFVQACTAVTIEQITHDFVLNVAKSVTDSRKKVLEGVGKGMAKLNAAHGQS